ncbi:c-type cytochrome [Azospirillum halopraeferens]|uniref:c-type cytochrome n=1 Tax=Azospirillum halopraeferens TaxID=34010 RepID=UPI00068726EF|nr:c-type cytochrome [Azospirillum halopraeferens]
MKCHPCIPVVAAAALFCAVSAGLPAAAHAQEGDKPYTVEGGKVDQGTYNGFRRYHSICHTCHGPDGLGGSFAPNLAESLKVLKFEEFIGIVAGGRQNVSASSESVMPAFAHDPNVMDHIQDIYAYLKARSDGVLGRGRPERLAQK